MNSLVDLPPMLRAQMPAPATILVVDDEPRLRQAFTRLLAGPLRQIEECATGAAAIERLARGDVDVVLLDLGLPDIGGDQVMDWMAKHGISTSIVVCSANTGIDCAIHALRRGAFEFIRKHSEPELILSAVERALRQRRLEQEHAEMGERLAQSERLHRFLVEQSPDLIYTLDDDGFFVFFNGAVEKLLGYPASELLGKHFSTIVHPEDVDLMALAFCQRPLGGMAAANFELRFKTHSDDIRYFDNRLVVDDPEGEQVFPGIARLQGTTGVARDISERKCNEAMMAHQAFHDPLTGLPNRALFLDRLSLAMTQASRREQHVGVLFIDLDRFKMINDTFGHLEGDRFLLDVAARLRHALRAGDTLARHGGDEFTVLLPDVASLDDVVAVANKALEELRRPCLVGGSELHPTASFGMAIYPEHGELPDQLIRNADIAMYHAKAGGKNCARAFLPAMSEVHSDRVSLEHDLRQALLDGGQFELHFQPQVSYGQRRVTGLEALLRWLHPKRGYIRPDLFIALAEEAGLISEISDWVLHEACRCLAELIARGHADLTLGINLSASEFERADLIDRIAAPLARFEVPPELIDIEITEGLLLKDTDMVVGQIEQLRRAGLQVSVDDFGTRYSSMNYLRHLPFSRLKIDQSFVRDLGGSQGSQAIVHAILVIARGFGMEVIAEGVETEMQRDTLDSLGCDHMQGYLFSRPLRFDALLDFLSSDALFVG